MDERSDLFSVGVMVVEALTGCRPFTGKIYTELLSSILDGSFHLETGSKEAERLDAVLQKCLEKAGRSLLFSRRDADRADRGNSRISFAQHAAMVKLRGGHAVVLKRKLKATQRELRFQVIESIDISSHAWSVNPRPLSNSIRFNSSNPRLNARCA